MPCMKTPESHTPARHRSLALDLQPPKGGCFLRCRSVTLIPAMPPSGLFLRRKQTAGTRQRHERPEQAKPATCISPIILRERLEAD